MLKVNFKKLNSNAAKPIKANKNDAGFDLTAISSEYDRSAKTLICRTGLAIQIPVGYVGKIYPRSSIYKRGLVLANSVGVIDAEFTGEIKAIFYSMVDKPNLYAPGDRIMQIIIEKLEDIEFEETHELEETGRRANGFGSSDNTWRL